MSASVADHAFKPENRGQLSCHTHYGVSGEPGNGHFVSIWLLVEGDVIKAASYQSHGCIWAMACGNATVTLIKGRPVEKVLLIEPKDIDLLLGGIPDGKGECADRCVSALRSALGE